jgi:hypothetical protein
LSDQQGLLEHHNKFDNMSTEFTSFYRSYSIVCRLHIFLLIVIGIFLCFTFELLKIGYRITIRRFLKLQETKKISEK